MHEIRTRFCISFTSILAVVSFVLTCYVISGHVVNMDNSKTCPSDPTLAVISRAPRSFTAPSGKTIVTASPAHGHVKLVEHPCRPRVKAFISLSNVYVTKDDFTHSTDPLALPTALVTAAVTDAVFSGNLLFLITGGQLLRHNYVSDVTELDSDVSGVSDVIQTPCCDVSGTMCESRNRVVVAYKRAGGSVDHVFVSRDGGQAFQRLPLGGSYEPYGAVISHSYQSVRLLVLNSATEAVFLDIPYETNTEVATTISPQPFAIQPGSTPSEALGTRMMKSGFGSLLVWDSERLFYSPNGGLTVSPVDWYDGTSLQTSSFTATGQHFMHVVSGTAGHFVAVTTDGKILYGREGFITRAVDLPNNGLSLTPSTVGTLREGLLINSDWLVVYRPDSGTSNSPILMTKTELTLTSHLAKHHSGLPECTNRGFGASGPNMTYVDKKQTVTLYTSIANKRNAEDDLIVSLSNPSVVKVTSSYQPHIPGTDKTKRLLITKVVEKPVSSTVSRMNETLVNIRVTSTSASLTCRLGGSVVHPVTVGCPPSRRISVIQSGNITDCPSMRRYSYTVSGEHYDPSFRGRVMAGNADKTISYDIAKLGCPIKAYYNDRFVVRLSLFDGDDFVEHVDADYVLHEVHSLNTYEYCQTASQAGCTQPPQTWSHMLNYNSDPKQAWNRQNYCDCRSTQCSTGASGDITSMQYQILRTNGSNCLVWKGRRNGIHIFEARVIDPQYSYCELSTVFSVIVYGADAVPDMQVMVVSGSLILFGLSFLYVIFVIVVEFTKYRRMKIRKQQRLEQIQIPGELFDKIDPQAARRRRVQTARSDRSASTQRSW